jgi:hypothetical protein
VDQRKNCNAPIALFSTRKHNSYSFSPAAAADPEDFLPD